nr:MAG TPA: hypothetical protein [Caudoviricetes sp.]DAT31978.1 MAG TPA: hypothetical protein [Caudoviricetes sp.]
MFPSSAPARSGEVWLKFWVYSLISWLCVYYAIYKFKCKHYFQIFLIIFRFVI